MQAPRTLLIVDDDPLLREMLGEQFALHEEFRIREAETAAAAFSMLEEQVCDLVLLDTGLPDMSGGEACRIMRRNGFAGPIIMLITGEVEANTVAGLDAGADDHVRKPFRFSLLLARVRACLRHYDHNENLVFHIGPYAFKPAAKVLLDGEGRKIRLTEKEVAILKYLYRAGGKPVRRDELLAGVWGYNTGVSTHTVETHIYRLRRKMESGPSPARLLLTDEDGYLLVP